MRWPWIGRLAYDALCADRDRLLATTVPMATFTVLCAERDHLRGEVNRLVDHLTRLERWERGMPETVRPDRKPIEPMPNDIAEYVNGFGKQIRTQMTRDYYRARARGETVENIRAVMLAEEQDES